MRDALGHKIEVDKVYGHSTRTSGFVTVVIGRVMEIGDKGIVLNVIHRGQSIYGNNIKKTKIGRGVITVLSNSLFPVNEFVDWEDKDPQDQEN